MSYIPKPNPCFLDGMIKFIVIKTTYKQKIGKP